MRSRLRWTAAHCPWWRSARAEEKWDSRSLRAACVGARGECARSARACSSFASGYKMRSKDSTATYLLTYIHTFIYAEHCCSKSAPASCVSNQPINLCSDPSDLIQDSVFLAAGWVVSLKLCKSDWLTWERLNAFNVRGHCITHAARVLLLLKVAPMKLASKCATFHYSGRERLPDI